MLPKLGKGSARIGASGGTDDATLIALLDELVREADRLWNEPTNRECLAQLWSLESPPDRSTVEVELRALIACAVISAARAHPLLESVGEQVEDHLVDELAIATFGHMDRLALYARLAEYETAIRSNDVPSKSVFAAGKAFARRCGSEYDVALIATGSAMLVSAAASAKEVIDLASADEPSVRLRAGDGESIRSDTPKVRIAPGAADALAYTVCLGLWWAGYMKTALTVGFVWTAMVFLPQVVGYVSLGGGHGAVQRVLSMDQAARDAFVLRSQVISWLIVGAATAVMCAAHALL